MNWLNIIVGAWLVLWAWGSIGTYEKAAQGEGRRKPVYLLIAMLMIVLAALLWRQA